MSLVIWISKINNKVCSEISDKSRVELDIHSFEILINLFRVVVSNAFLLSPLFVELVFFCSDVFGGNFFGGLP